MLPESRRAVIPNSEGVAAAVACLRAGGLVGLPTETVYGLAALAADDQAVRRVFAVKGRPSDHPLIVHLAQIADASDWALQIPTYATRLASSLWPGPLTLILRKQDWVPNSLTGGQPTVAVRVPSHPVARAVISGAGPVAAPSANRFGRVSPTNVDAVAQELADALDERDLILDGGDCAVGVESTIVDCTESSPRILRAGFYGDDVIEQAAGVALDSTNLSETPRVPGSLAAHYAPQTRVTLLTPEGVNTLSVSRMSRAWLLTLASEPVSETQAKSAARRTRPEDATAFARLLYATLRAADAADVDEVIAIPPQGRGIAVAIRDRLQRAAAGSGVDAIT